MKKEKDAIVISQTVTVVGMILASSMFGLVPVLVGFLVHEFGRGFLNPLKQAYINRRIPSEKRATVLSFESMVRTGGAVVGLVLTGWIARDYSISLSWLVSGIILALGVMVFLKLKNGE